MEDTEKTLRFNQVYNDYYAILHRYTARRVNINLLEDVLSELFSLCFAKLDKINPGEELPWLYRSCYLIIRNLYRKRPDLLNLEQNASSAESEALANISIKRALSSLSNEEREVLFFVVLEGFSYQEIAKITGLSENNVAKRFSRAKDKFLQNI
jgi:RNA polymerase sigma factor (sigma-70 family)